MSKKPRSAALLVAFALALAATPAAAQDQFKIGLVSSQTGPVAFLGDPLAKGAKLAIDRANAAGGVNGGKIEFVSYDDEASADKALIFVKKLIGDDKVPVIIGPNLSSLVRAVLPTTEAAKVVLLYDTPVIEPQPQSYNFTPWPSEETSYRVALAWMQKKGIKSLGILATTDTTGESGVARLQALSPSYGIAVSRLERMDTQDKDVTAQMTNIRQSKPEAIFYIGSGAAVAVVCKAYTRLALSQPLALSTGAVSAAFPELLKGITPDQLVFPTYKMAVADALPANDPDLPAIREFNKLYQATYNRNGDFFGGAGWDLANIAIDAMKHVGGDPTKIRDFIQQIRSYPATMATLTFTPDNHRGAGPEAQVMGQFKDGKFGLAN